MARYWIGGTGNWSDAAHWSDSTGGTGGFSVPTLSDDVFFDANSFSGAAQVVTLDVAAECRDVTWTGATNTPTLAGSQALSIYGNTTLISGMTLTCTGSWFLRATNLGHTLTMAGRSLPMRLIFGDVLAAGTGSWTLQDALVVTTTSASALTLGSGTLDCGSSFTHTIAGGVAIGVAGGAGPCVFTPHDCIFVLQGNSTPFRFLGATSPANPVVVSSNTAIFRITAASGTCTLSNGVNTNGLTVQWQPTGAGTLLFTLGGTVQTPILGALTVTGSSGANILTHDGPLTVTGTITQTGSSVGNRLRFGSATRGTSIAVSAGLWANNKVDFEDITAAGPGMTNTDVTGDLGGNSGTFVPRTPRTLYWFKDTGNFSNTALWGNSTGVADASTIPLPQDTARFDANSFSAGSKTVTFDVVRIGSFDWTGATNTPTMSGTTLSVYGSAVKFISAITFASFGLDMRYRGAATITSAGKQLVARLSIENVNGTLDLVDALDLNQGFRVGINGGTFNSNNFRINCVTAFDKAGSTSVGILNLGSSLITISGTGTLLDLNAVGIVLNAGTSQFRFTSTSGTARTIAGGNKSYYDVIDANTGGAALTITGNNSFNSLDSIGSARTVTMPASGTQTIRGANGFFPSARAGRVVTLVSSTPSTPWNLVSAAKLLQVSDYLNLTDCTADVDGLWYAGGNSTNTARNTNWRFTATRRAAVGRTVPAQGSRTVPAQGSRTALAQGSRTVRT